jgi:hypothetical protein
MSLVSEFPPKYLHLLLMKCSKFSFEGRKVKKVGDRERRQWRLFLSLVMQWRRERSSSALTSTLMTLLSVRLKYPVFRRNEDEWMKLSWFKAQVSRKEEVEEEIRRQKSRTIRTRRFIHFGREDKLHPYTTLSFSRERIRLSGVWVIDSLSYRSLAKCFPKFLGAPSSSPGFNNIG